MEFINDELIDAGIDRFNVGEVFDTHDFLRELFYQKKATRAYVLELDMKVGGRLLEEVHPHVGIMLSKKNPRVEKIDEKPSRNLRGKIDKVAVWRRLS